MACLEQCADHCVQSNRRSLPSGFSVHSHCEDAKLQRTSSPIPCPEDCLANKENLRLTNTPTERFRHFIQEPVPLHDCIRYTIRRYVHSTNNHPRRNTLLQPAPAKETQQLTTPAPQISSGQTPPTPSGTPPSRSSSSPPKPTSSG